MSQRFLETYKIEINDRASLVTELSKTKGYIKDSLPVAKLCVQTLAPEALAVQAFSDIAGTKRELEAMYISKLPAALLILSVAMNHLKATPIRSGTSHQMDKRKCNTATCATQRLTDFLVHSSNNLGPVLPPTNVGSHTYGKRNAVETPNRESLDFLLL
ncbi:islet amyloid polypeptide [Sigmodon hispidus]